jgi:hypothetical protein
MKRQTKSKKQQPKYSVGDVIRLNFIEDDVISIFQGQIGIIVKIDVYSRLRYKILVCGIPNESFSFSEDEISGKVEDERNEQNT